MQAASRLAGMARLPRELSSLLRVGRKGASNSVPAARRHYTGTVLERETERAEFASGLLSKVGGKRLSGAGFEVRAQALLTPFPYIRPITTPPGKPFKRLFIACGPL